MRYALMLLVALCATAVMNAADGGVKFRTITSWSEALDLAKAEGKPIFLDAYTDWCGWCKVMDKETFSDERVATVMNASYVNLKMEMETGEGVDVSMKFRISSFPTFVIFTPDGMPVHRISGYQPPEQWLATLNDVKPPFSVKTPSGITPTLKLQWPEWHRASYGKGKERKFPDTNVVRTWFNEQTDKYSEVAWSILLRYDLGEQWEQWAIDHEAEYRSRYGDETDQLREMLAQRYFNRAVKDKNPMMISKAMRMVKTDSPAETGRIGMRMFAMYHQRLGNWKALGEAVKRIASDPEIDKVAGSINEFAWSIYEKGADKDGLDDAITAMQRVTSVNTPDWAHIDTYAALLYKAGRMDEARTAAQRAIELGRAQGADVKDTEALLVKINAGK